MRALGSRSKHLSQIRRKRQRNRGEMFARPWSAIRFRETGYIHFAGVNDVLSPHAGEQVSTSIRVAQ